MHTAELTLLNKQLEYTSERASKRASKQTSRQACRYKTQQYQMMIIMMRWNKLMAALAQTHLLCWPRMYDQMTVRFPDDVMESSSSAMSSRIHRMHPETIHTVHRSRNRS